MSETPPESTSASFLSFSSLHNSRVTSVYFLRRTGSIQQSPKSWISKPPLFRRCVCFDLKDLTKLTPPLFAVQHSKRRSLVGPFPSAAYKATGVKSTYRRPRFFFLQLGPWHLQAFLPPEAYRKRHPLQESSAPPAHFGDRHYKRSVVWPVISSYRHYFHIITRSMRKDFCTMDFLATKDLGFRQVSFFDGLYHLVQTKNSVLCAAVITVPSHAKPL